MRKFIFVSLLAITALTPLAGTYAHAATVPCEDIKVQIDTALQTTKPVDTDKAEFDKLVMKGDERCKSEDDRRADGFYTDALAILGSLAAPTETVESTAPVTPAKLGDLSSFKMIADDTLKIVAAGDLATAQTRISELETAWDAADATLKPLDKTGWRAIDMNLDAVLSELRASTPDAATTMTALRTLNASLAASK